MAIKRLQLLGPRPYFAELPYYLWGQANYDSEGDCKRPTDRLWTWIDLTHRGTRERVQVWEEGGAWAVEGMDQTVARVSMFLIERCGGADDPSLVEAAGAWEHAAAMGRAARVLSEFEQPALRPFDSHWFWGSWKWIGWYATDCTWVGRWIMHSVVRRDPRAIPLCIDWIKDCRSLEQAAALAYAVQTLSGEPARTPKEWVRWYEGDGRTEGARRRFPEPDMDAWLADLQREFGGRERAPVRPTCFSPDTFLRELDNPEVTRRWVPQMSFGRVAYDFLRNAIRGDELNVSQLRNAMHALFRLRDWGSSEEVLGILVDTAGHKEKLVRSEAVLLALGLVQFSEVTGRKPPLKLMEEQIKRVENASRTGLEDWAEDRLRRFSGKWHNC